MFERFYCIPEYTAVFTNRVLSVRKGMQQVQKPGVEKSCQKPSWKFGPAFARITKARLEARKHMFRLDLKCSIQNEEWKLEEQSVAHL